MSHQHFFKQLRDELHGHPYRERFLEELEAHAEDLKQEKLKENEWEKRMGKPLSVKENFMKIMHPFGKLFFILEGLFYGLMFIPFTLFFYFNSRSQLYYSEILNLEGILFYLFLTLIVFFLIHFLATLRFFELKKVVTLRRTTWVSLIFLPGFLTLILNCFFEVSNKFGVDLELSQVILILITYLIINGLALLLTWKPIKFKFTKNKAVKFFYSSIKVLAGLYFLGCIVFRTIISYTPFTPTEHNFPEPISFLQIFSPFAYWIEVNIGRAWTGLMNASLTDVSLFMAFYLPVFILLFLAVQSLWVVIKTKTWLSLRSLIVIYVFTLFLVNPNHFIEKTYFKAPYINISEIIEKKENGIFYPILKYFNADHGAIYTYDVGFDTRNDEGRGDIVIRSNTGKIYRPDFNLLNKKNLDELNSISYSELFLEVKTSTSEEDKLSGMIIPQDIYCNGKDCGTIDFLENYIWNKPFTVTDFAISDNRKWALVVVPNRFYDFRTNFESHSQEVYLVKLKG